MLQDSQSIIAQLKAIQTHSVKQAEKRLKNRARQGFHFLINLYQIILRPDVQENVKISAISFINSSIVENLDEINSQQCLRLLISIISNKTISNFAKKLLHNSLVNLIEISELQQLQLLTQVIFDLMQQADRKEIGYFIILCFSEADLDQQIFMPFISKIFQPSIKMSPFYYKYQESSQSHNIQYFSCEAYVRIMKELILSLLEVFSKLMGDTSKYQIMFKDQTRRSYLNKKIEFILQISNSTLFCQMFKQILNYQNKGKKILVCCDGVFAQHINNLKYITAQLITKLLSFIQIVRLNTRKRYQHQLNTFVLEMIQPITATLILFGDNRNKVDDFNVASYLANLLSIVTYFFNHYWKQSANSIWKQTHQQIIYRFLQADEMQKQLFQENFEEFNAFFEDCCNKQESSNLKSQACKLLETIGNFQPNSINYACQRALFCLLKHLNISISEQQVENNVLSMFTASQLRIIGLQQCFFILAACSYHISQLPLKDLHLLKTILSSKSIDSLDSFEISRLFFFLSYSFSDIFTKQQGRHLIQYAFYRKECDAAFLSGLDFISNNLDQCFDQKLVKLLVQSIPKPQPHSLDTNSSIWKYFAILQSIMTNYTELLSTSFIKDIIDGSIQCLKILIQLYNQSQSDNYTRTSKISTQLIFQITHNLQIILKKVNDIRKKLSNGKIKQQQHIVDLQKQYDVVKFSIWNITQFLDTSIKLNFDDQIIRIITQFIKYQQFIQKDSLIASPIKQVIQMFKLVKYSNASYLIFFNQFFMKSEASECEIILQLLVKGLKYHIQNFKLPHYFGNYKIIVTYFLIVLQNLIAIHGADYLENSLFLEICRLCCSLIPQNNQQIFCKPMVSRAINLLMICHLYYPNNMVLNILLKLHEQQFYRGYDLSVLLQCISKQITKEPDIVAKAEYLNICIRLLNQQKAIRQQQIQQTDKISKISNKINQENYEIILTSITTPFKTSKTNSQIVRQFIKELKANQSIIYNNIYNSLNFNIKTALDQILSQQSKRTIFKIKGTKTNFQYPSQAVEAKKRQFEEEPSCNVMQSDQQVEECRKRQLACKKQKEIKQARQLFKKVQNQ